MKIPAPLFAFISAVLFAAGMPTEKWLMHYTNPIMLAGLLYLGSGSGITILLFFRALFEKGARKNKPTNASESQTEKFNRRDLAWLIAAIVVGGIFAPLLLLGALSLTKASSVALLLNFEIVITALVAKFVFHEVLSKRVVIGLATIFAGGLCLSFSKDIEGSWSLLLAMAACLCWAVDSNLTSQVKHIPPMRIAQCKGFLAGSFSLCLALALGSHLPPLPIICGAAATGVLSHGFALICFVTAMRQIGAARTAAYIATEPFIGAVLAVIFLHESVTMQMVFAGLLMGAGVWLHLTEKHPAKHVDGTIIASGLSGENLPLFLFGPLAIVLMLQLLFGG